MIKLARLRSFDSWPVLMQLAVFLTAMLILLVLGKWLWHEPLMLRGMAKVIVFTLEIGLVIVISYFAARGSGIGIFDEVDRILEGCKTVTQVGVRLVVLLWLIPAITAVATFATYALSSRLFRDKQDAASVNSAIIVVFSGATMLLTPWILLRLWNRRKPASH